MKLSLVWMFDHIRGSWKSCDVAEVASALGRRTVEIERVTPCVVDVNRLSVAEVTRRGSNTVQLSCAEWSCDFEFPLRDDAHMGMSFFVTRSGFATYADFGCDREGLVPAVYVTEAEVSGAWKKRIETEDYVIEVDNKAINHRPDLWGHRGFAREVAALFSLELKPWDEFLTHHATKQFDRTAPASTGGVSVEIADTYACKRLATLYVDEISSPASLPFVAHRLMRVGQRPINAIVDATNYVMFDIGQPMHAFDANRLARKAIAVRHARKGEVLALLDGTSVTCSESDLVITDGTVPLSLAGIMGGSSTAVTEETTSLVLEAGNFDATLIRRTSARVKKRTDASSRFEKGLDLELVPIALDRFVRVLRDAGVAVKVTGPAQVVGKGAAGRSLEVAHSFITRRLGESLAPDQITSILDSLGFVVRERMVSERDREIVYTIQVPSWRAGKDISIPEDIIEEIGRLYGYETLKPTLPSIPCRLIDSQSVTRVREIKQYLARAGHMTEVQNYALYDQPFIDRVGYKPSEVVTLANPLSEHWQYLVDSLMPHLIKNVCENRASHPTLRLFEWGRTWRMKGTSVDERHALAGILFQRTNEIDFYESKTVLEGLFQFLEIPVTWRRGRVTRPWYHEYQSAELMVDGAVVGYAGLVSHAYQTFVEGSAFVFEIDGTLLREFKSAERVFTAPSKYQEVTLDVSVLVPRSVTVDQVTQSVASADARITQVYLTDFFEKEAWGDTRSCTIRYHVSDREKTMERRDIDGVVKAVESQMIKLGATIR